MKHILVIASTFPSHDGDPVPAFVKDQLIALKKYDPTLRFSVLAPHDVRSNTKAYSTHEHYDEYRFHYFWPFSFEKLAGRGIMPALKANPINYLLIPFLFLGEFFALLRLTKTLKPDLLYAHWFTPQGINARWVSTLTQTPFVFTTHASDVDVWNKIPVFGKAIVRSNAKRAKAFSAVSRRSMEKLARFFSENEWTAVSRRGQIIPMGVNIAEAQPKALKTNNLLTILFVGRLAEKKGVAYLLEAFAKLETASARLIIAGDGPLKARLERQAAELGISDMVSFPGFVSGAEKSKLVASADVYVVPSIIADDGDAEGLPVSLMEGLAFGKICIATNESGADDILKNGKSGFLIPQKDSQALLQALEKALRLTSSERQEIEKAVIESSQQFDWRAIAKKHAEFLFT